MGDRSNIVIESTNGAKRDRIYLYAHWSGEGVIKSAIKGLKSGRVGDPAYLTRIIFCDMVKDDIDSETGFGISTSIEKSDCEYGMSL